MNVLAASSGSLPHYSLENNKLDDFFKRIKEQEDMIRRFAEGPLGDPVQRDLVLARASELARTMDTDAVARAFARFSSPEFASSLDAVSRQTEALVARMRTPEFLAAMDRAVENQRQMIGVVERMALSYKSFDIQIMSMASRVDAALRALQTFDFNKIGGLIAATEPQREMLALATEQLIFRHAALIEQLALPEGLLQSLPSFATEQPTLGVFVHTSAVRSITPHQGIGEEEEGRTLSLRVEITDETVVFLEQTLPS